MALPFPVDRPMYQAQLFPDGQPPILFNLPVGQDVIPWVPFITSGLCNAIVSDMHRSPIRMFTYNFYANNGWNNSEFSTLVNFAVNMLVFFVKTGRVNNPQYGLVQAVDEALQLTIARLCCGFPDLNCYLNGQQQVKAAEGAMRYQSMEQQFLAMQNGMNNPSIPYQNQIPNNYPQNNMMVTQPVTTGFGNQMFQNNGNGNGLSYGNNGNNPSMFGNRVETAAGAATSRFHHQFNQQGQQQQMQAPLMSLPSVTLQPPPVVSQIAAPPVVAMVETDKVEEVISVDGYKILQPGKHSLVEDGSMDRSQHSITFLGKQFPLGTAVRVGDTNQSVDALQGIKQEDMVSILEGDNTASQIDEIHAVLYPGYLCAPFLEHAIFDGRILKRDSQANSNKECNVFRCFSVVAKPILSIGSANIFKENFKTFDEIAKRLNAITISTAELIKAKEDNAEEKAELFRMAAFVNECNKDMTTLVNDFLTNKLSMNMEIDSFIEDVTDLGPYISKKKGDRYLDAYEQFQYNVCRTLFEELSPDLISSLEERLGIDSSEGICYLPIHYSLTYVDLFDCELGLENLEGKESKLITMTDHPWLFKIAESVFEQKKGLTLSSVYDLLITSDDVRYKLHRGYLGNEAYLISKA